MKLFSQEFYVRSSADTSHSLFMHKNVLHSTEYVTKRLFKKTCIMVAYICYIFLFLPLFAKELI